MNEENKFICESFNRGCEPEEIRDLYIEKFKPKVKTAAGKAKQLAFVRRVLRRNADFLVRPYVFKK